jgi:hypothetical protein
MDPMLSTIVGALAGGAAELLKPTAEQAVKDGYAALKAVIARKFGAAAPAVAQLEAKPDSTAKQASAAEDLAAAKAQADGEVLALAKALLEALGKQPPAQSFEIKDVTGPVNAGGTVHGGMFGGDKLESGSTKIDARGSQGFVNSNSGTVTQSFGDRIDTGGGAFVRGNVSVGGDFVGRDKIVNNTGGDAPSQTALPPRSARLARQMAELFTPDDLAEIAAELGVDAAHIDGETLSARCRALVRLCQRAGKLDALEQLIADARPGTH